MMGTPASRDTGCCASYSRFEQLADIFIRFGRPTTEDDTILAVQNRVSDPLMTLKVSKEEQAITATVVELAIALQQHLTESEETAERQSAARTEPQTA